MRPTSIKLAFIGHSSWSTVATVPDVTHLVDPSGFADVRASFAVFPNERLSCASIHLVPTWRTSTDHRLSWASRSACASRDASLKAVRITTNVSAKKLGLLKLSGQPGDVIRLAIRFGRYGYRQITNLLRIKGWEVNHKRVERIWRQEGLKVPRRQPKQGRLWLNDGPCIRLRPLHKNHVWSYDFVSTRTYDGRALKLLTVPDEYLRQCLAIRVGRKTRPHDVLKVLTDLFARHGPPEHLRSDNGPEFTAKLVRR